MAVIAAAMGMGIGHDAPTAHAANAIVTVLAPLDWPVKSTIKRTQGQRQAIVFADPNDGSARAALSQAIEVSARSGAPFTFCFVGPAGADESYFDTPLVGSAFRMGLGVQFDPGGVEAGYFGASTSGVCVAYDARGRLCFYGDLAPSGDGYSKDDGSEAAVKGLSRIRAKSDHLFLCPITGPPLRAAAAAE
ncbi:hypothetical protein [Posidoniimonas polymericola]|nr:hypothetical protein [Posidoniimonas polymericola]